LALVLALCLTFIVFRLTTAVTGGLRLDAVQSRNLLKPRYQLGYWDLSDRKVKVAKIGEVIAAKVVNSSHGHGWMEQGARIDGSWCEPLEEPGSGEKHAIPD
jgi:hypothetical protein